MSNADLTRLLNDARVSLPGAIDDAIRYTLFTAMDEFLRATEVWKEDLPVPVVTTLSEYDIEPEEVATSKLVRLVEVKNSDAIPVYATMPVIGTIKLASKPTVADTYTVTVVLTVGDPVTSAGYPVFPEWILYQYREALLSGVLGKMMLQAAKAYSNQTLGTYHTRRFEAAKTQGKVDAARENVRNAQAWRYPGGW